jgi:hypothetical protein
MKEFDVVGSVFCPHEPKKCDIKVDTGTKSRFRICVCLDCLNSLKAGIDSQLGAETGGSEVTP